MATTKKKREPFPPTTARFDPELLYRARKLALENKREKKADGTIGEIFNAALAEYLRKRGA